MADNPSSLSSRMQARSEQLDKQKSEWFEVPRFEGILEVELRAVGFRAVQKVISRNERQRDEGIRNLYTLADQVIQATMAFREVDLNGRRGEPMEGQTWVSLAQHLLPPTSSTELTMRQALLLMVGEERIHFFAQEYTTWVRSVRVENAEEMREDFAPTG